MPKSKVKLAKRRERLRAAVRQAPLLVAPDYGTSERWNHATRKYEVLEKDSQNLVARVVEECTLDRLHLQGRITGGARAAGLRLRHAYMRARIEPSRTGKYDKQPRVQRGSGYRGFERSDGQEAAYGEWREALTHVPPRTVDVLVSVCCIGDAPPPALLPLLRDGLDDLYRHYERTLYRKV